MLGVIKKLLHLFSCIHIESNSGEFTAIECLLEDLLKPGEVMIIAFACIYFLRENGRENIVLFDWLVSNNILNFLFLRLASITSFLIQISNKIVIVDDFSHSIIFDVEFNTPFVVLLRLVDGLKSGCRKWF